MFFKGKKIKSEEVRNILLDDVVVKYRLIRKNIKNSYLRFHRNEIVVSTNFKNSINFIEVFIMKYKEKVKKHYLYILNNDQSQILYFLGKKYNLLWEKGKNDIELRDDRLILRSLERENINSLINKWYEIKSKEIIFIEFEKMFLKFTEKYNLKKPTVKLRMMKKRWGTCYPTKNIILFNKRLIELDYDCIDYVMIHELAHLIEANHSRNFYKVIENVLPNYKNIVKKMKKRIYDI